VPTDFSIKQGDEQPILAETLVYSNGEKVNLTGATVTLILRQLTSPTPVRLTGTPAITSALEGGVSYAFSAQDTAQPGMYMASWQVTFAHGGGTQTFPTDGYLSVWVEENLTAPGTRQIISLPEVKDRLSIPANDRVHDSKLVEWIEAVRPLIENLTGPIVPQVFDEWYAGGSSTISLRHRPHTGFGTTPILNVLAVGEYRGPIEYDLLNVNSPAAGQVYSVLVDKQLGYIARRTAGGGAMAFASGGEHAGQDVHVRYEAGQETVPANVKMAAVEALKWWWNTTQPIGKGLMDPADAEQPRPMVALPYHCESMLAPTRKGPSIA